MLLVRIMARWFCGWIAFPVIWFWTPERMDSWVENNCVEISCGRMYVHAANAKTIPRNRAKNRIRILLCSLRSFFSFEYASFCSSIFRAVCIMWNDGRIVRNTAIRDACWGKIQEDMRIDAVV